VVYGTIEAVENRTWDPIDTMQVVIGGDIIKKYSGTDRAFERAIQAGGLPPGSPFDFAHLADSRLRALRIKSPNHAEPFPSTISSACFRSPRLAFYHFRSGPDTSDWVKGY
jgi:hypothetical protein